MTKRYLAIVLLMIGLSACSSGTDEGIPETDSPEASASADAPETTESPSENEQGVETFVGALKALGIEHSEAVRTEAGALSRASYDITINGFDASIQIFDNEQTQSAWVEASDSLGGVCVTVDGAALSLNSSEGVANSAEIAPKIAREVGGEPRGH